MIPLLLTLLAQTPAPTPQKCSLEGTVVSATTGTPLKKVSVTLIGGINDLDSITAVDGKFKFENLEPGRYTMKAERVGYLEAPDTALTLQPGELIKDLKLTPQAIIAGRVVDEDGDPILGARVAYIRWIAAGEKKFKLEEDLQDVNGEGGFTITGLSPGNYYLQALPDRLVGRPRPGQDFAVTFYPNALDLTGAGTLVVAAGAEVRGLEIRMRKSPTFRVRGKVSVPADASGVPTSLQLISQDSLEMSLGTGASAMIVNGRFQFEGVPPGSYILRSIPNVRNINTGGGEFSLSPARFFCQQPVEVSDRDVADLAVSFTPAVDLSGAFHADGVKLSKPPFVMLLAESFPSMRELRADADLNGAFHIAQLPPDRFELAVSNLPDGAYVKSIRQGAQEVKGLLDLTAASGDPLEIELAPNAAEITGTLRDGKGDPLPFRVVNLWTSGDDSAKSAQTARDGSFTFKNLAPGDYHLAAWDDIDKQSRPAFLKAYESQARRRQRTGRLARNRGCEVDCS